MAENGDEIDEIIEGLTPAERAAMRVNDAHSVDGLLALKPGLAKRLHAKGLLYVEMSPHGIEVSRRLRGLA